MSKKREADVIINYGLVQRGGRFGIHFDLMYRAEKSLGEASRSISGNGGAGLHVQRYGNGAFIYQNYRYIQNDAPQRKVEAYICRRGEPPRIDRAYGCVHLESDNRRSVLNDLMVLEHLFTLWEHPEYTVKLTRTDFLTVDKVAGAI